MCEPPQNTNYHFFKDLQRYLLQKKYNSRVGDIVSLITANALRIQLDIINEISLNNIYTTSLVPSGEYRGNLMLHLHKDHFSSVICKGRQPTSHGVTKYSECLTYTSNCLRSFRDGKHYRVSRKVRKTLFHLHIWQPTDVLAGNDCNEGVQLSGIDQLEKPTKAGHSNLIHIPLVEQQKLCNQWITVVQWLASGTPTRTIRVRFPSDWLLHPGDNRGRHSANHNLLPDRHLRVPVLRVKRVVTVGLFKMSGR